MIASRTASVAAALVVVALLPTGCGSPAPSGSVPAQAPASTVSPLPPRPTTLTFVGVDPCDLLPAEHRQTLGVGSGRAGPAGGAVAGVACSWSSLSTKPDIEWAGSLLTKPGAEFALGKDPIRFVQGFATTSTTSIGTDPRWYCAMFVDIGPGHSLYTIYDNATHDIPGMNHQLACEKAQQLAEYMLTALKARQPR